MHALPEVTTARTRVLVVDDSGFYRRRIIEMLASDPLLEVVGFAIDGQDAVAKTLALAPDVVTMDVEMPVMDGIRAVREIMRKRPTPILMFSSLTCEGARATLDALAAGALDFIPKQFQGGDGELARRELCTRARALGARTRRASLTRKVPAQQPAPRHGLRPELVAIGTSTGGPAALTTILSRLPAHYPLPLLLIQHMPASFTPAFAARLNEQCAIEVRQAVDGDRLQPGLALLAPGGRQLLVEQRATSPIVRVVNGDPALPYKPSVDVTLTSLAEQLPGKALALVLTGMGHDGREGARRIHADGGTCWAQDEASSVVYGMPAAIAEAGLAERVLALDQFAPALLRLMG
jgi:two-component system chemotaxis response regulator CheB